MSDVSQTAFIYSEKLGQYSYGSYHPLKMARLKLTRDLLKAYGVLDRQEVNHIEPSSASIDDVKLFHADEYISVLRGLDRGLMPPTIYRYGLGPGDNPIFPGVYELSLLITGGSVEAAQQIKAGHVPIAFNMAGGLHHALPDRASGFCYFNDPVIAIKRLVSQGQRVMYLDVDVHHGDGVQAGFYDTDQVMTISLHEDGQYLFPGTGFVEETGRGAGLGYSVNLPLYPGTDDETYLWAFEQVVPPLIEAFKPDVLVTQLGVDTFVADPLAHLRLTTHGFCAVIERIKSFGLPWVALGGGGYNIANVARAWALAYAIMNGIELPDEVPPECAQALQQAGLPNDRLRDPEPTKPKNPQVRAHADQGVRYLHKNLFPLHGISP
jgi:acetoin utilization protein AcuC